MLAFYKYNGDQVLGVKFEETSDKRKVGLNAVQRLPDTSNSRTK